MSHIDSFKHELVGLFGGLPLYHPLEKIDGDFQADERQLILGGGSGEHPAMVIENPLAAVAWFLRDELNSLKGDNIKTKDYPLKRYIAQWESVIKEHESWDSNEVLKFYDWTIETYKNFYDLSTSKAMPNPYSEDSSKEIEEWLILGLGEFIFFAMPELASPILEKLEEPYQYFTYMQYNNVLVIPKNFPLYANGGNAFKFK